MKAKFLVFCIGLSLLVSFNFAQAQITATTPDLEALVQALRQQIEDLRERILQLQGELKGITTELKEVEKVVKFTQNLHKGLRSKEVERLQEFLSKYPEIYPEGLVTGYFGPLTENAVKKFQEKHSDDVLKPYGLNKGTGFVGEKTIAKINELLTEGAGASGVIPPGLITAPGIQEKLATTTESERKITICHYPPDNPDARHTIVIDESALEEHLAHGDTIGACESEPEPEDVCPNIDGVQETIPEGMIQDNEGNCVEPEPGAVLGCTDETATNYNSEATQDDGTCVYPDITPPVISNFQPSGTITDLTPTLSLNTDENATCRYVGTTDQSFDSMLSTFSGVGATYHHITLGTMTAGTYTYYARCQDTAGNKNTVSASITFTITTETADTTPPVISNIQVSNITQTSATITWQTNEESNSVVNYGLTISYGFTVSGETGLTYHEVNLTNLTNGAIYHYKVNSTDNAGNQAQSSDKTFTTLTPTPDTTPPDNVTNFTAVGGDGQVNLSWTNPTDTDFAGTKILRKTGSYPSSVTDGIPIYTGTGTSYIDTGLTNGTTYYYKAFTYDEVPNYSSGVGVNTTPSVLPDTTSPVISNIQVSNITETSVTITWQTNEESDSVVNYGLTTSYGSAVSGETAVTYHEVNLSNLTSGTTHHYKINSTDSAGNKAESEDKTFATYAPPIAWENIQITDVGSSTMAPSLDWSGDGYGLAWKDGRHPIPYGAGADIYFIKLDADGTKITNELNLTVDNQMRSFYPKIIWNGSEFGIIWEYRYNFMNPISVDEPTDCSLLFTRVSNSGVQQGGNVQVITRTTADLEAYSSCPAEADMVWDGGGYGVVWKEKRAGSQFPQIHFRRIDANGQSLTDDIEVTRVLSYRGRPSIVWTGTEYGVAWNDSRDIDTIYREIYFVRLDTAGAKQGSEIRITNTSYLSWKPDLHWNGSGYDLFWIQNEAGRLKQIYFAKLNSSGNKITNDIDVTANPSNNYPVSPHAVWDGTNYGVTWTLSSWIDEEYDDVEYIIYFAKVDPNGSIINIPARVSAGSFQAKPAISWSGSKYGIAWSAPPGTGGYDIYFASGSGEVAILEQEQQLSFVERLLKDIQSQVAAISTAISELLK